MARRRTSQFRQGGGNVIEGVDDLIADLERLADKVTGKEIVDAMKPAAAIMVSSIKSHWRAAHGRGGKAVDVFDFYAKRSGHAPERILDGIFFDARKAWYTIGGPSILIGVGHWHSPNWHFMEYGVPSHGIPAQPFIRPGREASKASVNAQLQSDIKKLIDSVAK